MDTSAWESLTVKEACSALALLRSRARHPCPAGISKQAAMDPEARNALIGAGIGAGGGGLLGLIAHMRSAQTQKKPVRNFLTGALLGGALGGAGTYGVRRMFTNARREESKGGRMGRISIESHELLKTNYPKMTEPQREHILDLALSEEQRSDPAARQAMKEQLAKAYPPPPEDANQPGMADKLVQKTLKIPADAGQALTSSGGLLGAGAGAVGGLTAFHGSDAVLNRWNSRHVAARAMHEDAKGLAGAMKGLKAWRPLHPFTYPTALDSTKIQDVQTAGSIFRRNAGVRDILGQARSDLAGQTGRLWKPMGFLPKHWAMSAAMALGGAALGNRLSPPAWVGAQNSQDNAAGNQATINSFAGK